MTIIMALESSCDDMGVAILKDGTECLANVVASQEKIHAKFGGVVPEVASREHLRAVFSLVKLAMKKAKVGIADIDYLAVTAGPGLLGSLLVGVNAAKTLAWIWNKPLIPVNHLAGHVYSGWLNNVDIEFPVVSLVASGGHTEIVLMKKHGDYIYLGGTVDDAIGEAFDKVARYLKLGYPGGPAISRKAASYSKEGVALPRPMLNEDNYNFSFSGLKTAVTRVSGGVSAVAKGFEEAAVEVVVEKLIRASRENGAKTIIVGGGVAANNRLREELFSRVYPGLKVVIPAREYCTDNAAMIGVAGYFQLKAKRGNSPKYKWYNTNVTV